MHFFQEYLGPLTSWLHQHPNWGLLITFLISFSESLAIVGSIVPGSVTMTAVGILAGAGIMRIDLTMVAAILGAIGGDGASYALGFILSERLTQIWPFKKHPNLINYGKDYFAKHGAASVLIGRFVGPIRSIIPVIAGMMKMNYWQFAVANVLSAILWSIVYVGPGILIGAASMELSAESSTRLFLLIILVLLTLWLLSIGLKKLYVRTHHFLKIKLHYFWVWLGQKTYLHRIWQTITPPQESNHARTAFLIFLLLFCLLLTLGFAVLAWQSSAIMPLNQSIFFFLQSVRTQAFDAFFIIITLIISPYSLLAVVSLLALFYIYKQDWRTFRYWISLACTCSLTVLLLSIFITTAKPQGLPHHHFAPCFPEIHLAIATALFGFLILSYLESVHALVFRILLLVVLFLAGFAPMYLGDNWLSNVLAAYWIGVGFAIVHWLFYRRRNLQRTQLPIFLTYFALIAGTITAYYVQFTTLIQNHHPYLEQYVISDQAWWNQQQPILPIYSTNRIGQRIGLFNIQYAGSIKNLQAALEAQGWKHQSDSFFLSFILRAGGVTEEKPLLLTELYLNRKPTLRLTYTLNDDLFIVLSFWRSNFHLQHYHQPIWLGSVRFQSLKNKKPVNQPTPPAALLHALQEYKINIITLPKAMLQLVPTQLPGQLLIIKEPEIWETLQTDQQSF